MPRPERIARPARTDEWEIVAADKGVADDWTRWAAQEPNALAAAHDQLSRNPTEFSPRQKKLEGKTWGTGTYEGRTYHRWQYEVTSGGRIFYSVEVERVGPRGGGWSVAMSTLMNERTGLSSAIGTERGARLIRPALAAWQQLSPADARPVDRDRLAHLMIEAEILRLTLERSAQAEQAGVPGPAGSMIKLGFAKVGQAVAEFCLDVGGPGAALVDHYDMTQPQRFTNTGEDKIMNGNKDGRSLTSRVDTLRV